MEKIKKFWNEASIVKKIAICVGFILFGFLATGFGGPSACACANLNDSSPFNQDYTPSQMNEPGFLANETLASSFGKVSFPATNARSIGFPVASK